MKAPLLASCVLFVVVVLLAACVPLPPPTPAAAPQTIANPASEYCVKQGGTVEIRSESTGQVGYCKFPNGRECEEWAFMRGECYEDQGAPEAVLPEPSPDIVARAAQFKPLDMSQSALLAGLNDWERAVLDKLMQAADLMDKAYWQQVDPEGEGLFIRLAGATGRDRGGRAPDARRELRPLGPLQRVRALPRGSAPPAGDLRLPAGSDQRRAGRLPGGPSGPEGQPAQHRTLSCGGTATSWSRCPTTRPTRSGSCPRPTCWTRPRA